MEILEKLKRTKPIAAVYRICYPSYGTCYICGLPWAVVKSHNLSVNRHEGFFHVCEYCWQNESLEKIEDAAIKLHENWIKRGGYSSYTRFEMLNAIRRDRFDIDIVEQAMREQIDEYEQEYKEEK